MNIPTNLDNLLLYQVVTILSSVSKPDSVRLVGGCVRDMILSKHPKDFDLVCSGDLDTISKEFLDNGWKVTEAGKQFLVLKVSKFGQEFDIALYRKDGTYVDGRRPESVDVGDIHTDSARRDFTINALYLDPITMTIDDPTGKGLTDIQNKVIRFVGKAKDRITEDYLRIMRAYRFASVLGFTIEPKQLRDMRTHFDTMCKTISPTRIMNELEKMI